MLESQKKHLIFFITLCLSINSASSQETSISLKQDPKFELLLSEKRKINQSLAVADAFKIQIYLGTSELAKKTISNFKLDFKEIDGTIIFASPNYKVWVGNFRSRIEAERQLLAIKEKYKNAFLIRPNK